jgi:hypothetical protein
LFPQWAAWGCTAACVPSTSSELQAVLSERSNTEQAENSDQIAVALTLTLQVRTRRSAQRFDRNSFSALGRRFDPCRARCQPLSSTKGHRSDERRSSTALECLLDEEQIDRSPMERMKPPIVPEKAGARAHRDTAAGRREKQLLRRPPGHRDPAAAPRHRWATVRGGRPGRGRRRL